MSVTEGRIQYVVKTDLGLCLPRSPLPHSLPTLNFRLAPLWPGAVLRAGPASWILSRTPRLVSCSALILKRFLNKWPCIFILHWALQITYAVLTSGAPGTQTPLVATLCLCTGWAQALRCRATSEPLYSAPGPGAKTLDVIRRVRFDVLLTMGHTFLACSCSHPQRTLRKPLMLVVRGDWPRDSSCPKN